MSEDLISRQEAINRIEALMPPLPNGDYQEGIDLGLIMAKTAVKEQPSAQQKAGRWIDITVGDMPAQACNQCKTFYPLAYTGGGHQYCPNCGAKMEKVENK